MNGTPKQVRTKDGHNPKKELEVEYRERPKKHVSHIPPLLGRIYPMLQNMLCLNSTSRL